MDGNAYPTNTVAHRPALHNDTWGLLLVCAVPKTSAKSVRSNPPRPIYSQHKTRPNLCELGTRVRNMEYCRLSLWARFGYVEQSQMVGFYGLGMMCVEAACKPPCLGLVLLLPDGRIVAYSEGEHSHSLLVRAARKSAIFVGISSTYHPYFLRVIGKG